jgi:hypothetical protein
MIRSYRFIAISVPNSEDIVARRRAIGDQNVACGRGRLNTFEVATLARAHLSRALPGSFMIYDSSNDIIGRAASSGTRHEATATTSRADFQAPPPPAGPLV